ncbi:aldehyde dehydrogenase family protein [Lagierella sp.]|uniref:aldehyde dehydrogenase family protein n=1 Tax=Lagierella sp. TaxID=2849657 RepID=UPI00261CD97A|nr:aldehyde dehydrogenase family protein [Lagierella sp.]
MNTKSRIDKLKRLKKSIEEHREAIFLALKRDLGKSETEVLMSEYNQVMEELNMAITFLPQWTKKFSVKTPLNLFPAKSYYVYRPYGTVGIASPWNYPFQLSMIPLISAIAAGNKVVLKVSKKSINTSEIIFSIINESLREDVVYYGLDEGDKKRFIEEDLDMLFFTGSSKVGKQMGIRAAEKMIPYILELGGKSPCIVKKSADLKIAAKRILWGKTMNSGQTCVAPDYVLVDTGFGKDLKSEIDKVLAEFYGSSPIKNETYSKMISVEAMDRLKELSIEEGIYDENDFDYESKKINPNSFITTSDSPFMKEEIFGPFLPIIECDTWVDVNSIINKNPNPLAFYIFTKSKEDVQYVVNNFNFGGMAINDVLTHLGNSRLPFGGVKNSGFGRYHGLEGFKAFSQQTSILENKFSPDIKLRYPPYGKAIKTILK